MGNLAKERLELGREKAGDPLLCGTAYGLVCFIEAEFQKLRFEVQDLIFRLEALEKIHPFSLQDHRHTEKEFQEGSPSLENLQNHLERLEEDLKKLKLDAFLETMPPEPMPPDPPTDKDGKPLEQGDVISYIVRDTTSKHFGEKFLGQFRKAEGNKLWGYWQSWKSKKLGGIQAFMPKEEVTFEFRPPSFL